MALLCGHLEQWSCGITGRCNRPLARFRHLKRKVVMPTLCVGLSLLSRSIAA